MSWRIIPAAFFISVTGCSEMGSDPEGPNLAHLVLQDDRGRVREFYLGGYSSLSDCVNLLQTEIDAAAGRSDEFWTNRSFDYGGVPQEGWIRHTIVGAKCQLKNSPLSYAGENSS